MGYYPILKTTWKYFPEKKGFLTGLILCVFGLCPSVFTSVADAVINPEGKKADKETGLFDDKIAKNMKTYALIMSITMGVCGVLSQFLMFPMDNVISTDNHQVVVENNNEKNTSSAQRSSYVSNEIYTSDKETNLVDNNNEPSEDEKQNEQKKITVNEPFMQAFKSCRFHLFNFMSVGTLCK